MKHDEKLFSTRRIRMKKVIEVINRLIYFLINYNQVYMMKNRLVATIVHDFNDMLLLEE